MAFIQTIPPSEAHGPVREMYQQVERRFGYVPNWAQAFSLRPGDAGEAPLTPGERAMMAFAEKVALNADRITSADVDLLRSHGYRDVEIFDVAAAAAARCFFSKLLDALGVQADASFNDLDPTLREALTVGRPVADRAG